MLSPVTAAQGSPGPGGRSAVCVGLGLKGKSKPQGELCAAGRVRGGVGQGDWLSQQTGCSYPLCDTSAPLLLLSVLVAAPTGLSMEVMAPTTINALNGSSVKLSCTFNSCYKVENKQFSLNWTYQECRNCSEELVSLARAGGLQRGPGPSLK